MNGGIAQFGLVVAGRPVFTDFTYVRSRLIVSAV